MPVLGHIAGAALADSVQDDVDVDAGINPRLSAAHEGATAAACDRCLRMETLRWNMDVEARDAVLSVEAALDDVRTACMLHHDMLSVMHLPQMC